MYTREKLIDFGDCSDSQLQLLCEEASRIRDNAWGGTCTYSRKVFVPLTNMCRDTCSYCTFVQKPGSPAASIMTPQEVMKVVKAGQSMGCKEVLFSLGEKPELRYPLAKDLLAAMGYKRMTDYLRDMCELVLSESELIPHINAGTLAEDEVRLLKPVSGSMGMMLESTSTRLMKKGGPHHACPDKAPKPRLQTLAFAGKHSVPFTTGILIGIGETWAERVDALLAINELHQRYGHIQEVIVQNFKAKPGTVMAEHPEPSHRDMLLTLAVARLILDPSVSLQAPPNLDDSYGDYIGAGINDWGGISPFTLDHINPERAWPQIDALQAVTAAHGLRLQERLTIYPRYLKEAKTFIDKSLWQPLFDMARDDGLAAVQIV